MIIIKIFFISFLFFEGCSVTSLKKSEKILGKWELTEKEFQVNYPILYFNTDSTAMFTSRGDTIYRFKYLLKSENIILKDLNGKESTWKISVLNEKELVFEKLFENIKPQHYKKVPNDINNK
jgi:hypothetical protein